MTPARKIAGITVFATMEGTIAPQDVFDIGQGHMMCLAIRHDRLLGHLASKADNGEQQRAQNDLPTAAAPHVSASYVSVDHAITTNAGHDGGLIRTTARAAASTAHQSSDMRMRSLKEP